MLRSIEHYIMSIIPNLRRAFCEPNKHRVQRLILFPQFKLIEKERTFKESTVNAALQRNIYALPDFALPAPLHLQQLSDNAPKHSSDNASKHPASVSTPFWEARASNTHPLSPASRLLSFQLLPPLTELASRPAIRSPNAARAPEPPPGPRPPSPPAVPLRHSQPARRPAGALPPGVITEAAQAADANANGVPPACAPLAFASQAFAPPACAPPPFAPPACVPAGLREDLVAVRVTRGGRCASAMHVPPP